ncbi:MAG: hypothetical protein ABI895_41890 [Deltaproteobacteria bacterium]
MPSQKYNPSRIVPQTLLGVGAWLLACGTERVELGPGQSAGRPDSVEGFETPSEYRPTVPGLPQPVEVPSLSPSNLSESGPRALPLLASAFPGTGDGEVTPGPAGGVGTEGCGKADLLFVVDNSLSMRDRQAALAASFPGFIQVVEKTLGFSDFHIMVVDTDGRSSSELLRDSPVVDSALCEEMRGAGRRLSETGASCNLATEQRFMVQEQPELEQTFACIAQVGTDGSAVEHSVDAMLDALSPALNEPGGCNAGFLRDDAILFITLITDEDDRHSEGEPADWRDQVLARKGGNSDAIVALGIVPDGNLSDGVCRAAQDAPRLQSFASSLGLIGSACADDYSALFQQAVGWLAGRCAAFVPPLR